MTINIKILLVVFSFALKGRPTSLTAQGQQ